MTICVRVIANTIEVLPPSDACELQLVSVADVPAYVTLFEIPANESIQTAFIAGFSIPMICYMAAWAFGSVVKFINRKSDTENNYYD